MAAVHEIMLNITKMSKPISVWFLEISTAKAKKNIRQLVISLKELVISI